MTHEYFSETSLRAADLWKIVESKLSESEKELFNLKMSSLIYCAVLDTRNHINRELDSAENMAKKLYRYTPAPEYVMPELPDNYTEKELLKAAKKVIKDTGSKLNAVKFVKDKTGWGLYDSKQFCDQLI